MRLWRLTRRIHARKEALHRGAEAAGGRWNERGVAVVYASPNPALVALEYLVHLNPPTPGDLVLLSLDVPDNVPSTVIDLASLGPDWNADSGRTQELGSEWARSTRTLLLEVPSVIVPEAMNSVLNPAHPDWKRVRITVERPFTFDVRLFR
jgi:RES domain-containing protein